MDKWFYPGVCGLNILKYRNSHLSVFSKLANNFYLTPASSVNNADLLYGLAPYSSLVPTDLNNSGIINIISDF